MPTDVEETQEVMVLPARCRECEQTAMHELYVLHEEEGKVVLLTICGACEAVTALEGADEQAA
jgi:formate dehydrogenase maturation protein FdhE